LTMKAMLSRASTVGARTASRVAMGGRALGAAPTYSTNFHGNEMGYVPAQAISASAGMCATTIVSVRKDDKVVIAGDGQVTLGQSVVMKPNACKVRRLSDGVISGFAGSTADAITLFERLESKIEEYPGQLLRACVELAKAWRTDKYLRKLDALMLVSDHEVSLMITGNGDVLEPVDGVMAIGSGGSYALAAARALQDIDGLDAEQIARKAMGIAGDMCVFTNHNLVVETVDYSEEAQKAKEEESK